MIQQNAIYNFFLVFCCNTKIKTFSQIIRQHFTLVRDKVRLILFGVDEVLPHIVLCVYQRIVKRFWIHHERQMLGIMGIWL